MLLVSLAHEGRFLTVNTSPGVWERPPSTQPGGGNPAGEVTRGGEFPQAEHDILIHNLSRPDSDSLRAHDELLLRFAANNHTLRLPITFVEVINDGWGPLVADLPVALAGDRTT